MDPSFEFCHGPLFFAGLIDPPQQNIKYSLTETTNEIGETVLTEGYYCDSKWNVWQIGSLSWQFL